MDRNRLGGGRSSASAATDIIDLREIYPLWPWFVSFVVGSFRAQKWGFFLPARARPSQISAKTTEVTDLVGNHGVGMAWTGRIG
jgi:hypothetical protein